MNSYHIFYFPFSWEIKGKSDAILSDRINLNGIKYNDFSEWDRVWEVKEKKDRDSLYNEKNYYTKYVHPILYDTGREDSLLHHFVRKEVTRGNVSYNIELGKGKTYELAVDDLDINIYATGIGILIFYLSNIKNGQGAPEDILNINQYGRRIFPLFIQDKIKRGEIAKRIFLEGLNGAGEKYMENFNSYTLEDCWKPAGFITDLIKDLSDFIVFRPVIDDRMFVNCWYPNDSLGAEIEHGSLHLEKENGKTDFNEFDDFWYKYVFIDHDILTCQNDNMRSYLIGNQTYKRWQKYGTLYGISRYSFVSLTKKNEFSGIIATHMRTVYARMVELVLVQRASVLNFSEKTGSWNKNSGKRSGETQISDRISSLYKEYIKFINGMYFREVTIQDQGVELYELMTKTLKTNEYIRGLENEIGELYRYVSLQEDKRRNKKADFLNIIAAFALPTTVIAGLMGVGGFSFYKDSVNCLIAIAAGGFISGILYLCLKK